MSVRIHVCGRLSVEWDGAQLEAALPGRQGRLLFAYLALHRSRPVRRDELVEALWSEEGPPPGGDSLLAPPLSRLRKALGPGRLEGRAELSLCLPEDTWIDFEAAREGLERGRSLLAEGNPSAAWAPAQAALTIVERGLLPGLEANWIDRLRTELADARVEALEAVASIGARLGSSELPVAEQAARAAVLAAPFRESARLALMQVLRARGNLAEALVAYEELRVLLREELGLSPGPAVAALYEELLHAEPEPPRAPPARVSSAAPTVARVAPLPDRLAQAVATPLVGRGSALERLRDGIRRAEEGETGLIFVLGDGGIGKTRLVAELARENPQFSVFYGRCDEEELAPFGPWVEMLQPLVRDLPDAELAELVGAGAADLARLLPELRTRLPELAEGAEGADPETERRRLFVAVVELVVRLAERGPLLMVIDDLHWADRSSLLLGRHLVREPRLGSVLMLGTYRDNELGPGHVLSEVLADLERDMELERLRITGMDADEVAALIGSWHGEDVEEDTVRAIREETDGNPFFVKQLVRHLEEGGGVAGRATREGFDVPAGVRDVIARRVARLPEHAGHVLRVASLIGRDFELDLLEQVVDVPDDELLDVLDAAVRGAILAEVPSTPGRYSFAHALLRTALEDELTATRRARLHRRIGEAIERRHRDRVEPQLADLARHFAAAGPEEVDRAVDYAERAAAQASSRLAYDEAVALLAGAVAGRERDEPVDRAELARLLLLLAQAESRAGDWEGAQASFARAADAAREADAAASFTRAALGHSGGVWERFGTEEQDSADLLEEALERLPDEDSPLRSQTFSRLAGIYYYMETPPERVLEVATEALAMARRLRDPQALMMALAAAQYARWRPGCAAERLELAEELVELAGREGDLVALAEAHLWRALSRLEMCELEEADADLARHAELAERLRQPALLVHRDALRSMRALLAGDYAAGLAAAQEVFAWGERQEAEGRRPTPMHMQFYGVEMISILNEQGEMGQLAPYFEQLVREIGALPGWRTPLAWAYVQSGRPDEARAELDDLRADGFAVFPRDTNFIPALTIISHICGELGDSELAAEIEPQLAPYAEFWVVLGPGPSTLGPVAYCLGVVQSLQGREDDAIASFELALARSEAMRARPYIARSQAGMASALRRRDAPGDAGRAAELAAAAEATARALGMSRLLSELEAEAQTAS